MKNQSKYRSHVIRYLSKQNMRHGIDLPPAESNLHQSIVIPAYKEVELLLTIESLAHCNIPPKTFEVLVILNSSIEDSIEIKKLHQRQLHQINSLNYHFKVHGVLIENTPSKTAGVGHARKIGMDLALHRLHQSSHVGGLITCLDGDCLVSKNYLAAIQDYFNQESGKQAAHLHFEHPIPNDTKLRASIILYEMHLRLMKLFIQQTGHPQAFHAVGSCMVVRDWAYAAQGGMNSRQAGEDFYFIHKFSNIGQLEELTEAVVYPSARESDRVPFGTGAAVRKSVSGQKQQTYNPQSYIQIKKIVDSIQLFYEGDYSNISLFKDYKKGSIINKLSEIKKHTSNLESFTKRFFQWFDAFQVFKFLHHLRDSCYPDVPISEASHAFFTSCKWTIPSSLRAQLVALREVEKNKLIKAYS